MVGKGFIATGKRVLHKTPAARKNWYFIDGKDQVVGRMASQICKLLLGKHKPIFDPSVNCGDHVVVTNARHVVLTRNQWKRKLYRWHTGYPGGLREMPAWRMKENFPERVLEKAVWGMLPKNKLRFHRFKLLRVYNDEEHDHNAQLQKASPLPPHFKTHDKPVDEKLPVDDDLAHLREYYVVKFQKTDDAIRADGVYIPSLKEEAKREKQIKRYINRRPNQIQDLPEFGEYVADVHNEEARLSHGFDDVKIVAEEVAERRASGEETTPAPRQEVDEDKFYEGLQQKHEDPDFEKFNKKE